MAIYVLCGIPGSGKSTLAKKIAKEYNAKLYIFDELPGAHNPQTTKQVHQQMWSSIFEDLSNGYDVICDDLHTTVEWRNNILSTISNIKCKKILVVMNTPLEECLKRNVNRLACLPDFVLYDLYNKYESPTLNEGWDEIINELFEGGGNNNL